MKNAWRLRRLHEQSMFHHERELSMVSLKKDHWFRKLCAIHGSHLNICSFAPHIVSLFVDEKTVLTTVSEF